MGSASERGGLAVSPMELIRFAGANRLLIGIDYHAEDGRRGPRVVEPYSFGQLSTDICCSTC
jgi:hypothetical protein